MTTLEQLEKEADEAWKLYQNRKSEVDAELTALHDRWTSLHVRIRFAKLKKEIKARGF